MAEENTNPEEAKNKEIEGLRNEFNDKIENLKTELVAQEHRFLPSLKNLYEAFKKDEGDAVSKERKLNALLAFGMVLWKMRLTAIVLASAGGIIGTTIAVLTYLEFQKQNSLFREQIQLGLKQNEELIKQNTLFREQNRRQVVSTNGQLVSDLIGDLYTAKKAENIHMDSLWDLPKALLFRCVSVSNALEPYDLLKTMNLGKDTTTIIERSRERGELLQAMVALNVDFPLKPNPSFNDSNLSSADLSDADLSGVNLSGADLSGANLKKANISYVNLSDVNLRGANLRKAYLGYADLNSAILIETDLREVSLRGANLVLADFLGANLSRADLIFTDLGSADLSYANLNEANLGGLDLKNTKGVTYEQLIKTRNLFNTSLPSQSLYDTLMKAKPCLFEEFGCPEPYQPD